MLNEIGQNILVRQVSNYLESTLHRPVDDVVYIKSIDAFTHRVRVTFTDGAKWVCNVSSKNGELSVTEVSR